MPSLFAVTATTNTIILGADRKGSTSFTVSNTSGRAVRGRARLVPLNQTGADWLSIDGAGERDFAIAATQLFTVLVAVPASAAPGNYSFRLDMVGVDNPDEDYTQGPTIAFQVPEAVKPSTLPPWVIPAIAATVIVVGAIIAFLVIRANNQASANATATAMAGTQTAVAVAAETAVAATQTAVVVTAQAPARYVGTWVTDSPPVGFYTTMVITRQAESLVVFSNSPCRGTTARCITNYANGAAPYVGDPFRVDLTTFPAAQILQLTMLLEGGNLKVNVVGPNGNSTLLFHKG